MDDKYQSINNVIEAVRLGLITTEEGVELVTKLMNEMHKKQRGEIEKRKQN